MMKAAEYFDAAKAKLQTPSDYALAVRLGIPNGSLSQMRTGKRAIPNVIAYKLAITIEQDPALVLADIEAQQEKDPERRQFWEGFLSRARSQTAIVMLALACIATLGSGPGTHGGPSHAQAAKNVQTAAAAFWAWMVRIICRYGN